ncbi:MAG: hypothetical protein EOM53_02915 [Alphaproteobacteria bacterium]|nr:peptidoglycan DD-metalloendopeptidase family protein [Alphaproteobacteria bacterium]NCB49615.1 hypothetical protein [Alphaproteobacteria bacterium]
MKKHVLFGFLVGLSLLSPILETKARPRASSKDLRKIEQKIKQEKRTSLSMKKKASLVASEIMGVKKKMVVAARTIQDQELTLSKLEKNLAYLRRDQANVIKDLKSKDGQLVKVSTALQRLATRPTEVLLAQPMPPIDTLRSAILLREMVSPLESTAEKLRHNLNILSSLRAASRAQVSQIKIASARLEDKHKHMKRLLSQKKVLQNRFETESKEAQKRAFSLAQQARSLKDLLAKLEIEKRKRMDAQRRQKLALASLASLTTKPLQANSLISELPKGIFEKSKGKLAFPVVGRITSLFNSDNVSSVFSKGLTIKARKSAQVITPFDGVVLYSGNFKSYGNLLIIEHAEGYHSLLSGLQDIDVSTGQNLLAGEPVGIMSTKGPSSLYIELRKNNEPIDPLPWFYRK